VKSQSRRNRLLEQFGQLVGDLHLACPPVAARTLLAKMRPSCSRVVSGPCIKSFSAAAG
jgi:hypothetical protein